VMSQRHLSLLRTSESLKKQDKVELKKKF